MAEPTLWPDISTLLEIPAPGAVVENAPRGSRFRAITGCIAGHIFFNDTEPNTAHDCGDRRSRRHVPPLLDGLRILVLEDEFLIAMDVEQLCRDQGAADVTIVRDLAEIDLGHGLSSFDAAIVDLMLGGVSTLDFAKRLRGEGVPFVFASGYSDAEEIEGSFPEIRLVAKPYSGDDLIEAVALACGRAKAA
ncbi:response regulator [Mesorhizobium sp. WSM4906]|uniref:response regulator n=1 Tax=Mesorhizobium sp. WSM4906 TaxID=3038546 RepID=UPI00325A451B